MHSLRCYKPLALACRCSTPSPRVPSSQCCLIRGSEPKSGQARSPCSLPELVSSKRRREATKAKANQVVGQVVVLLAAAGHTQVRLLTRDTTQQQVSEDAGSQPHALLDHATTQLAQPCALILGTVRALLGLPAVYSMGTDRWKA